MESSQRVVRQRPKERLLDVLPRGPYPLADDDSDDGGREIAAAAPDAIPNIRVEHSIMFFIVSFASLPIAATSGTFGAMGECVFSRTSIHRLTETRPIRAILTHDVRSPSGRNRRAYTFRLMTTDHDHDDIDNLSHTGARAGGKIADWAQRSSRDFPQTQNRGCATEHKRSMDGVHTQLPRVA